MIKRINRMRLIMYATTRRKVLANKETEVRTIVSKGVKGFL
jgi:hypothetical protein